MITDSNMSKMMCISYWFLLNKSFFTRLQLVHMQPLQSLFYNTSATVNSLYLPHAGPWLHFNHVDLFKNLN